MFAIAVPPGASKEEQVEALAGVGSVRFCELLGAEEEKLRGLGKPEKGVGKARTPKGTPKKKKPSTEESSDQLELGASLASKGT